MPAAKKAPARPTSNAKLAERLNDLDARVQSIEAMIAAAQERQQMLMAQQLAKDPAAMQMMQQVLDKAKEAPGAPRPRRAR